MRLGRFVDTARILRELGVSVALGARPIAWIERKLAIDRLDDVCESAGVTRGNADVPRQIRDVFARAGIGYEVREAAGADPRAAHGPLVYYCNHPYGIADALIALDYALCKRPDTKVLANNMLGAFDLNDERVIWIDPFSDPSRNTVNKRGLREALKHLRGGGALLVFPSGVCSHLHLRQARITDPAWSQHLARLIAGAGAASVPIYFHGSNSWRFHALGLIHPFLRTLTLVREFVGLKGRRVVAVVGATTRCADLPSGEGTDAVTRALRHSVYALGSRHARDVGTTAAFVASRGKPAP